ncbi:MAG: leucine-rich repeat protein, partial [Eubacteriales bacterium]
MKKITSAFLAIMLVLSLLNVGKLKALAAQSGDFTYMVTDSKVTITKYTGTGGVVNIPASLGGYPVTVIGDYAFRYCYGLSSVTIPNSATTVGKYSFADCTGLTSATIPTGVTIIGDFAFYFCTGITSLTVPSSVITIGEYAFRDCTGLTSMAIPNSMTTIGLGAFFNCIGLTSVTIPNSVTSIGDYAFRYCSKLTSITIPNSVTAIGMDLFSDCTGLTSVNMPNSVTTIGERAFFNCTGLTSLILPSSLITIGIEAFYSCSKVTSTIIPNNVTSIGKNAFYLCNELTSVSISSRVISIGDFAFRYCTKLTTPYFFGNAPTLGAQVFDNNAANRKIYYLSGKTGYTNPWYTYPTATFSASNITFNANGGTGGTGPTEMVYGSVLAAPTVTKTNYIFNGWLPTVPGTVPLNDTTYTAQWSASSYTITWAANGGSGGGANSCDHGATPTPISAGTKTGYTFASWSPTIVAATAAATYTAVWTPITYDVTFDANGGSGTMTAQGISYQTAAALNNNTTITKTGYNFAGWNTATYGSGTACANQANYTMSTQGVTLYAQWTIKSYTITWDASGGSGGGANSCDHGATP